MKEPLSKKFLRKETNGCVALGMANHGGCLVVVLVLRVGWIPVVPLTFSLLVLILRVKSLH